MNTVEKLLKMDAGKLKMPERDVIMNLGKMNGEEFVFRCRAVDPEFVAELQEESLELGEGGIEKIRMYNQKVLSIIEGCPDVFKNNDVMQHFGAPTPKELVKKLLLSGEIDELYSEISNLNGYDRKKKDEVKN